jgi:hypothetical protein
MGGLHISTERWLGFYFSSVVDNLRILPMCINPTLEPSTCLPSHRGLVVMKGNCSLIKVEIPIHDNIRELVTWECKEHGVKS